MAKVIVYTKADGSVAVIRPVISLGDPPEFTAEDAYQRALANDVPASAVQVIETTDDTLPTDRQFRTAWVVSGAQVQVDMPKARASHRAFLQALADKKLALLDRQYQKAVDDADEATRLSVANQRRQARAAVNPPEIDQAQTPGELKAVLPAILR